MLLTAACFTKIFKSSDGGQALPSFFILQALLKPYTISIATSKQVAPSPSQGPLLDLFLFYNHSKHNTHIWALFGQFLGMRYRLQVKGKTPLRLFLLPGTQRGLLFLLGLRTPYAHLQFSSLQCPNMKSTERYREDLKSLPSCSMQAEELFTIAPRIFNLTSSPAIKARKSRPTSKSRNL